MSTALLAAALAAVAALVAFFVLQKVAERIEAADGDGQGRRTARILRAVAYLDVIVIPLVVYFALRMSGL